MNEFQDALDGKTTTEGWTAEKLSDYHKFLTGAAKDEEARVAALREAKRVEQQRVDQLKKDAEDIAEKNRHAAENPPESRQPNSEISQFRSEQIEKARKQLLSQVKLTDEERTVVEDKFKRLDSGKMDADLIYLDFLSAVAAANPTKYLDLTKQRAEQERVAAEMVAADAEAGNAAPGGQQPKKFSDEVMSLAKKVGITPEAAQKQISQGMHRTLA
jgi:hypothetical protein